jgi:hypothetical protein
MVEQILKRETGHLCIELIVISLFKSDIKNKTGDYAAQINIPPVEEGNLGYTNHHESWQSKKSQS